MPSVSGTLGVCPICSVRKHEGNMGYLRKCLLTSVPEVSVILCTSADCTYYDSDASINEVSLPKHVTRDYSGLDAILFVITRSVYLKLSFQNNKIPSTDPLYQILYLAIERKQHMYEIRNFTLQQCGECNAVELNNCLLYMCKSSPFLKRAFRSRWTSRMNCGKKCKGDTEEEGPKITLNSNGYMELSSTPSIVLPNSSCRTCKQYQSVNRYITLDYVVDFAFIETRKGISLPFEIGKTAFQTDYDEVYRLHAIITENEGDIECYLCDTIGHIRERFESSTKVSSEYNSYLASIKPNSVRFVMFEKLFDNGLISSIANKRSSSEKDGQKFILSSPIKYGPVGKKPRLYSSKTTSKASEKTFSSYVSQKKSTAHTLTKPSEQGVALAWRKQFQKKFTTLSSTTQKSKVSGYIATLQSLNMQILEGESKLQKASSGSFSKFSKSDGVNRRAVTPTAASPSSVSSRSSRKSKKSTPSPSVMNSPQPLVNGIMKAPEVHTGKSLQSFPSFNDNLEDIDFDLDSLDCLADPSDSLNNNDNSLHKDEFSNDFFEQMLKDS